MSWEAEVARTGGTLLAGGLIGFFFGRLSKRLDRKSDVKERIAASDEARRKAEAESLQPLVPGVDQVIERLEWYIGMLENRAATNPSAHAVALEKLLRDLQAQWAGIYPGISDPKVLGAWNAIKAENMAHDWERLSGNPNQYGKDRLLDDYEAQAGLALERVKAFRSALVKHLPGLGGI